MSFSYDKQANIIDAFNTSSTYLDDILNIDSVYFDNMVLLSQIYQPELQLNKANTFDTKAVFLDLHLSVSSDIVSTCTKLYDKRDDFDFEIVDFRFLNGDRYLNSKLDLNLAWAKDFQNLNSMVTLCINWRRLLVIIILNSVIKIISHYKKDWL